MSGTGAPAEVALDAAGLRLGIVATRWYPEVVELLLAGALATAAECGVVDVEVVRAPGAFELPLLADGLALTGRVDAVVALGLVVRGGTPHFDYVCDAATAGLTRVALDHGLPVGFGLLTCDDLDQAHARAGGAAGNKGREATLAALESALTLRRLHAGDGTGAAGSSDGAHAGPGHPATSAPTP